jgi:hypothetical protein
VGALHEKPRGVGREQWAYGQDVLCREAQTLPTGGDDEVGSGGPYVAGEASGAVEHMLTVVEHQSHGDCGQLLGDG